MARCECCGNEYANCFTVKMPGGNEHVFDSFECAIRALAPICFQCGTKIIGHGHEERGCIFCCVPCARAAGETALPDRTII